MISNCEGDAFIQIIIIDLEGTPRFCHSKNNNSVFETNQNIIIKHHQSNTFATHASARIIDIIDKQLHTTGLKPEAVSLSLANQMCSQPSFIWRMSWVVHNNSFVLVLLF